MLSDDDMSWDCEIFDENGCMYQDLWDEFLEDIDLDMEYDFQRTKEEFIFLLLQALPNSVWVDPEPIEHSTSGLCEEGDHFLEYCIECELGIFDIKLSLGNDYLGEDLFKSDIPDRNSDEVLVSFKCNKFPVKYFQKLGYTITFKEISDKFFSIKGVVIPTNLLIRGTDYA